MNVAGTTYRQAAIILSLIALSNLVHSSTFFFTLKYFPGGSTSAGVMKGLQAVLVFVVTHFVYCGRGYGGEEMCFTNKKFVALITVSTGVMGYGYATRYYSSVSSTSGAASTKVISHSSNMRKEDLVPLNIDGPRKNDYDHIA